VSAWDPDLAHQRATAAYRYVADVYPKGASYELLGPYTDVTYEAERRGDMEGFEAALRGLMRAAKREAMREKAA
jgi:hypothetical protein